MYCSVFRLHLWFRRYIPRESSVPEVRWIFHIPTGNQARVGRGGLCSEIRSHEGWQCQANSCWIGLAEQTTYGPFVQPLRDGTNRKIIKTIVSQVESVKGKNYPNCA